MNKIDYIEEISENNALSFAEREMKGSPASFIFSSSVTGVSKDGETCIIDTADIDNLAIFSQNYKYWNQETGFLSTNNFDNSYFQEIVNMGTEAVPYILAELEKGPSPLVHALDLIFPGVIEYKGFVSLKEACDKWLSILQKID